MTRREAWLTALGIFAVALAVRALAAPSIGFPKPEDTAYYVGVARNLVEGRGLVSDALWSYGTPPLVFPRPAFEVWLPLPSLLAAIPIALFAGSAPIPLTSAMAAARVVPVVAGAILSVLAWRLAADVAQDRGLPGGRARTMAIGAGLTTAVYLPLVLHGVLPDSTILFGVLVLGACLLMTRVLRDPRAARLRDPRLLAAGVLLGAAALTRNEAAWLALAWAWLAWRRAGLGRVARLRLIGSVAAVSLLVFAPWAARNWAVFGNPLPGQAISNALSITGFDIFAWNDPPTVARYLAVGPVRLLEMRVEGTLHNLGNVLLILGIPLSVVGLAALPWQARDRALRPVVLVGGTTFLVTSLLFPVATTWGTFLHAAAPVHVLLVISSLGALDAMLAGLGRRLGWTRPVSWLGAGFAVAASGLFTVALLPAFANGAQQTERAYTALVPALADAGVPMDGSEPVITDFPVWLAETARIPVLALPEESPADVLDLAQDPRFGAHWLVTLREEGGSWPGILDTGGADAACFTEVALGLPDDPAARQALAGVRLFHIGCGTTAAGSGATRALRASP